MLESSGALKGTRTTTRLKESAPDPTQCGHPIAELKLLGFVQKLMWFFSWDTALLPPRIAHRLSNLHLQKCGHPREIVLGLCQHTLPCHQAAPALLQLPGSLHSITLLTGMVPAL